VSCLRADDAEKSLLARILNRAQQSDWRELLDLGLSVDDFHQPKCAELAAAIDRLVSRGADPEAIAALDECTPAGREMLGGVAGLAALDRLCTPHALKTLADVVMRAAHRRRVHRWHVEQAEAVADGDDYSDPDEWREYLERAKLEHANLVAMGRATRGTETAAEVVQAAGEQMVREAQGLGEGVSTGLPRLDRLTGGRGPKPGWLMILGGRPKMGKTSLALSLTRAALFDRVGGQPWAWQPKHNGTPVLWACGEMPNKQLVQRIWADIGSLDGRAVTSPTHGWFRANHDQILRVGKMIGQTPLEFVEDQDCGRLDKICAAARSWRARHDVDEHGAKPPAMVVIDYLQRLDMPGFSRNASKEERVSGMAKACKSLALELGVVVVLLAQLNRDLERRDDKRPRSSDFRDSGGVEQEADILLGAYRPIQYDATAEAARARYAELSRPGSRAGHIEAQERIALRERLRAAEIIVLDSRHGPKGTCYADFIGEHFRYAPRPIEAAP
jgi:replicative DNA helicase